MDHEHLLYDARELINEALINNTPRVRQLLAAIDSQQPDDHLATTATASKWLELTVNYVLRLHTDREAWLKSKAQPCPPAPEGHSPTS